MFLGINEFICRSIQHMFPECRLLDEELLIFNRIGVKETCAIMVAKVVWISKTIVTQLAGYQRVDAHRIEVFVHPFE
jgi:hypothetical protein